MKIAIEVSRGIAGVTGVLQLVLGVLFWTGHARELIPFHMLNGMVFVVSLWTLAGLSARAGAASGLVVTAFAWGLLLPALGMAQMQLLMGPAHWVIQVIHLLTGLVAMGLADRLYKSVRPTRARGAARPGHRVPA